MGINRNSNNLWTPRGWAMNLFELQKLEDEISLTAKSELEELIKSISSKLSESDKQFFITGFKCGVHKLAMKIREEEVK